MLERAISEEIKRYAVEYVTRNYLFFARRGEFDGSVSRRIMGHIGLLMTKNLLELNVDEMDDLIVDGEPDLYDFKRNGKTYDVKTSYSYIYKNTGRPPIGWGLLIPDSQFQYQPHDFYIRCILNASEPSEMHKCCFLCACTKDSVRVSPIQREKFEVPMRVVPHNLTFSIERLGTDKEKGSNALSQR